MPSEKMLSTFCRCTKQSRQTFTVPPGPQCVHRSMLGLKFGLIVEVSDPWEVPPNADLVWLESLKSPFFTLIQLLSPRARHLVEMVWTPGKGRSQTLHWAPYKLESSRDYLKLEFLQARKKTAGIPVGRKEHVVAIFRHKGFIRLHRENMKQVTSEFFRTKKKTAHCQDGQIANDNIATVY